MPAALTSRRRIGAASRRRLPLPISADNPNPTVTSAGAAPAIHATQIGMPHDGQPHQGFPNLNYLGSGHLVAVYRSAARHSLTTRGSAGHGVILLAESTDYGANWNVRTIVDSPDQNDDRDPNLTILPGGTWLLTYPTWLAPDNPNDPPTGCVINLRTSTDQGATWSAETRVNPTSASLTTYPGLAEYLATTSPIVIATDGQYVIPATGRKQPSEVNYSSFMLRAATLAGPWTATLIGDGPADVRSYDEPFARKLANGTYLAFSRHGADKIARYTSSDGLTWNPLTIALNGGGSGRPGFTQLANGAILMGTRGSEVQNQVRFSRDAGVTWTSPTDLPPVAGRLATYQAHAEVVPNLIACVYCTEDSLVDGRAYFRYLLDGVEGPPSPDLALVSSATATSAGATSIAVNKPPSVAAGDLLILIANQRAGAATLTAPTGFSSLGSQVGTGKVQVWWKIADGTEASTLTVSSTSSAVWAVGCIRITNAETTAPVATFATATSATATTPAATIAEAGSLVLGVFSGGNANQTDVVQPTGYTEVFDVRSGVTTTNAFLEVASKFSPTVGTEPAASVSIPSQPWMTAAVVIRPATS